jgi:hypothetical protein
MWKRLFIAMLVAIFEIAKYTVTKQKQTLDRNQSTSTWELENQLTSTSVATKSIPLQILLVCLIVPAQDWGLTSLEEQIPKVE